MIRHPRRPIPADAAAHTDGGRRSTAAAESPPTYRVPWRRPRRDPRGPVGQNAFFEFAVKYSAVHPAFPLLPPPPTLRRPPADPKKIEEFRRTFEPDASLLDEFKTFLRRRRSRSTTPGSPKPHPGSARLLKAEIVGVVGGLTFATGFCWMTIRRSRRRSARSSGQADPATATQSDPGARIGGDKAPRELAEASLLTRQILAAHRLLQLGKRTGIPGDFTRHAGQPRELLLVTLPVELAQQGEPQAAGSRSVARRKPAGEPRGVAVLRAEQGFSSRTPPARTAGIGARSSPLPRLGRPPPLRARKCRPRKIFRHVGVQFQLEQRERAPIDDMVRHAQQVIQFLDENREVLDIRLVEPRERWARLERAPRARRDSRSRHCQTSRSSGPAGDRRASGEAARRSNRRALTGSPRPSGDPYGLGDLRSAEEDPDIPRRPV